VEANTTGLQRFGVHRKAKEGNFAAGSFRRKKPNGWCEPHFIAIFGFFIRLQLFRKLLQRNGNNIAATIEGFTDSEVTIWE
jgi:hypothetical protein